MPHITATEGLDLEALEGMVDRHGVHRVSAILAVICEGKSEHLRTNWQDHKAAVEWDRAATALDKMSERKPVTIGGKR